MKKIVIVVMILSFFITFSLFNNTENVRLKDFPFAKIISIKEAYAPNEDEYKLYEGLKKIEENQGVKIVKFTNFKKDNNIQYEFNSISESPLRNIAFFNSHIKSTKKSIKIENQELSGIFYFSKFNNKIEKELSYLGLSTVNYDNSSVTRKIVIIIYENYLYLLILTLILYTIKISYKRSNNKYSLQNSQIIKNFKKSDFILLIILNTLFVVGLLIYNGGKEILDFFCYYCALLILGVLTLSVLYFSVYLFFQIRSVKVIATKFNSQWFLINQSVCIILMYIVVSTFGFVTNELYLSYIKNPLKKVNNYTTVDLTSFSPEFFHGTKKTENIYKEFIMNQEDVVLSAYNVAYEFKKTNYDPYSGNSMLVSPSYFNTSKVYDNEGNLMRFSNNKKNNEGRLIIPYNQKEKTENLKKTYTEWMSFVTNIPAETIKLNIYYSTDNQDVYSYGYQNNIKSLKLNSPVILVVNVNAITDDQVTAFMSNRFFSFKYNYQANNEKFNKLYFAQMSKIKYLVQNGATKWLTQWIILFLSICFLILALRGKISGGSSLIDTLIWDVLTLTIINLNFSINKYAYVFIVLLMLYLCIKRVNKKN